MTWFPLGLHEALNVYRRGNTRAHAGRMHAIAAQVTIFFTAASSGARRAYGKIRPGMQAPAAAPKLLALTRLIGGTPLLEIHCRYRGREQRIYAKHEAYNFTGSIKDRMALYILQRAYAER